MVYLTYIIDHYEVLRDVTIFMHAHQFTYHNNDLLDWNSAAMVKALSSPKVTRDGYFNLRCHRAPGCPDHLHPANPVQSLNHPEEIFFGKAWQELFPGASIPLTVSQPCCSQFALSRERIRSIPLSRYKFFRDWLINTELEDLISGRIWEYVWQYLWMGVEEFCPSEHVCYCDGYGVCFGGEKEYSDWFDVRKERRSLSAELAERRKEPDSNRTLGEESIIQARIDAMGKEMDAGKMHAIERGKDPKIRALEAGREWHDGDGF